MIYRGSSQVYNAPAPATPSQTPTNISSNNAPNSDEGESTILTQLITEKVTAFTFEQRRKAWQTSGSKIPCAKSGCSVMLETGPQCQFCTGCGANQQSEETRVFKETMQKVKK